MGKSLFQNGTRELSDLTGGKRGRKRVKSREEAQQRVLSVG